MSNGISNNDQEVINTLHKDIIRLTKNIDAHREEIVILENRIATAQERIMRLTPVQVTVTFTGDELDDAMKWQDAGSGAAFRKVIAAVHHANAFRNAKM